MTWGGSSRTCIIEAAFDRIRYRRNDGCVFLYACDLIELNGDDLVEAPLVPVSHTAIRQAIQSVMKY